MKRSEMIKTIKDALYCHLPGYNECPDFIAEAVLQSIEFHEMLPPLAWIVTNPDNPNYPELKHVKELINEWEPEDE